MYNTKLTREVHDFICEKVSLGIPPHIACQAKGIKVRTLSSWIVRGKREGSGVFYDFVAAISVAAIEFAERHITNWEKLALKPSVTITQIFKWKVVTDVDGEPILDEHGDPKRVKYPVSEAHVIRPPDYKAGRDLLMATMGPVLIGALTAMGDMGEGDEDTASSVDLSRIPLKLRMEWDVELRRIAAEDEAARELERNGDGGVVIMDEDDWERKLLPS